MFRMTTELQPNVLPDEQFYTRPAAPQVDGRPRIELYVRVDDRGRFTGEWRASLGAIERISYCFSGSQIFTVQQLTGYEFTAEIMPENMTFPVNALSTAWVDVETAVAERKIEVSHPADPTIGEEAFLTAYRESRSQKKAACCRWAVNVHDDLTFSLDLQALPMSAHMAGSKPSLLADSAPTVLMGSGLLSVELYGHATAAVGPVPVFFAKNPELAKRNLMVMGGPAEDDIKQLTWMLLAREYVDLRKATELVHKPRDGHFRYMDKIMVIF